MAPVRAVLFDYVHTLADSGDVGALRWYFFSLARRRLVEAFPGRRQEMAFVLMDVVGHVHRGYVGSYQRGETTEVDIQALFDEGFRRRGVPLENGLLDEIVALNHTSYAERLDVPETTRAALKRMKQNGLRLGVVSNNMFQRRWMEDFPLLKASDGLLDTVILSSDIGVRKPRAQIYREALERLGVYADEAVFVGDRVAEDVRAPKALGMQKAFLTYEFRQEADPQAEADGILHQLHDLLDML
jgi:putative hydrolase of the HAD superfamily